MKICWILFGKEIMFDVNWLEYLVLKRIFKKRKYEFLKSKQIRRQKTYVTFDEASTFPKDEKINL